MTALGWRRPPRERPPPPRQLSLSISPEEPCYSTRPAAQMGRGRRSLFGERSLSQVRSARRSLELDLSWGVALKGYRPRCLSAEPGHAPKNPLQEWGEEVEDGVIYGVTLRRVKTEQDSTEGRGLMVDADSPLMPGCGFVQYKTCKLRTLKAGSLEKLVENLITMDGGSDPSYIPCFLSTYRAFTSMEKVLALLLDRRLGCGVEEGTQWPGSPAPDTVGIRRAVRHILSTWLEEYPEDFRQKPQYSCLKRIQNYLREGSQGEEEEKENLQASRLLQQFQEEDTEEEVSYPYQFSFMTLEDEGESDVLEEKPDLLSFPAEEVAEQLTLMDAGTCARQNTERGHLRQAAVSTQGTSEVTSKVFPTKANETRKPCQLWDQPGKPCNQQDLTWPADVEKERDFPSPAETDGAFDTRQSW